MGGAGSPVLWPVTTPRDPGVFDSAARGCLRFGEEAVLLEVFVYRVIRQ